MGDAPVLTRPKVSGGSTPSPGTRTLQTTTDASGQVTSRVRRTVLPSGLRVISEHQAGVRSAAIGVWVGVGSRDESPALHGCSHFLEHLLFKGTAERSALDISVALDAVGGEFNAFTAKEYTCFHARVLDEDLPLAVDVLGDMITSSTIAPEDVEAERDVILDEIAMHDDDPDDVVHNLFAEQAWGDSPLGRPIAGTVGSIRSLSREQVRRFYRRHYRPGNVVIAAAGNVDHTALVRQVRKAFARNGWLDAPGTPVAPRHGSRKRVRAGCQTATRPFEQVNVVLGMEGLRRDDERRFALGVLNTALGGGTSSRLFQEIRERRGLAYSVFSFATHHADSGLVGVSVGCLPNKLDEVLAVVRDELEKVAEAGITDEELVRGKGQLRGGLVLGLEDTGSRMSRIGKAELVHDQLLSIDEVIARIDAVTLEEVREIAAEVFAAIVADLRVLIRLGEGRAPQPSAVILDSRTVQSTPESGSRAGWDGAKRKKGTNVHLAVDTLGQVLAIHVTPANAQDRAQVEDLAIAVQQATGQTVTVAYVDQGYTGDTPRQAAADHGITLSVVKLPQAKRGFVLLPRRWVVERDFGWMSRFRRLARDQERLAEVLKGFHLLAFTMLMWRQALPLLGIL